MWGIVNIHNTATRIYNKENSSCGWRENNMMSEIIYLVDYMLYRKASRPGPPPASTSNLYCSYIYSSISSKKNSSSSFLLSAMGTQLFTSLINQFFLSVHHHHHRQFCSSSRILQDRSVLLKN